MTEFDFEKLPNVETSPAVFDHESYEYAVFLSQQASHQGKFLRIYLAGKDCDGFLYGINFDDVDEPGDFRWQQGDLTLVVDSSAKKVIRNASISLEKTSEGPRFVVKNPIADEFSGKFWHRSGPTGQRLTPHSPVLTPITITTEPGRYLYCACGLSKKGIQCDGSHGASGFKPMEVVITKTQKRAWCQCRMSKSLPYCDGAHSKLKPTESLH